jgi:hypothetical protein
VYSGKNAERNNLLMETFLTHEKENKYLSQYREKSPLVFKQKIDSLLQIKENIINTYTKEYPNDDSSFLDIFTIALTYPIYTHLEWFSLQYKQENHTLNLDTNYFNYRKNIDLTQDNLVYYTPYYQYFFSKICNVSYDEKHLQESEEFVIRLLNNIDKQIQNETIKNSLLYQTVIHNFKKRHKNNSYEKVFSRFLELNTNAQQQKQVEQLISDLHFLEKKTKISNFTVEEPTGNWVSIHKAIHNKPTALYFNNIDVNHKERIASRIRFFIKKYPSLNFKIVHWNNNANYIQNLPIIYQYKLPQNSTANSFLTSKIERLLLIDKKGIIQNGYTNLYAYDIEEQLTMLEKK